MPRSRSAALAAAGAIAMALLAGVPVAGAATAPITRPDLTRHEAPLPQPSAVDPPESTLPELTDASPLDEGIAVPPGAPFPSRIGAALHDGGANFGPAGATRGLPSSAD